MRLIVDCYNLLHAPLPPMLAGLDEAGLCRLLGRTPWARGGAVVVADGRVKPGGAEASPVGGVELVYSGSQSADDVIIRRIARHSAPRRLTVVSSDRQIRAAARRRRCRDLPSDQFVNRLCSELRRHRLVPPVADRPDVAPLPPELVEGWKKAFGLDDPDRP